MAFELADHVYSFCRAVMAGGAEAEQTAVDALRASGRRSLTAVLAHARVLAVAGPAAPVGAATPAGTAAPAEDPDLSGADPLTVARALARSRPVDERAVVDLAGRHGLDRRELGRALGTEPVQAAARADAVVAAWRDTLDPALLAFLGPGSCQDLASILAAGRLGGVDQPGGPESPGAEPDGPGSPGADQAEGGDAPGPPPDQAAGDGHPGPVPAVHLGDLLALAPLVAEHAAGCDQCADRLRALVSVHDLVCRPPLEAAPPSVRAADRGRRRVVPYPDTTGQDRRSRRRLVTAAAGLALAAVLGTGGWAAVAATRSGRAARVRALVKLSAAEGLAVQPASVTPDAVVRLSDRSGHVIGWRAATGVTWLAVSPGAGTLRPGQEVLLHFELLSQPPEQPGPVTATVEGDDGSVVAVMVRPAPAAPQLAATASGCAVSATAVGWEDDVAIQLHWRPPAGPETVVPMGRLDARGVSVGRLPASAVPLSWWVSARSAAHSASTAAQTAPPGTCS